MYSILRPYQQHVIADVKKYWSSGIKNVGAICCVGAGKTVIASNLITENSGRSLAVAHSTELVGQMSVAIAKNGVPHKIVSNSASYIRTIAKLHVLNFGESFVDQESRISVGGVKAILNSHDDNLRKTSLLVIDEAHHVLSTNEWGKVANICPNAYGLFPTATPCRTDGKNLGRKSQGVIDALVEGPSMSDMMEMGYICNYIVHGSEAFLKIAQQATISDVTGDYVKSQIDKLLDSNSLAGGVYENWHKFARDKLTIVFSSSSKESERILGEFRSHGVTSAILSSETGELERFEIMRSFRRKTLMVIINIGILGEGVDVPDVECIVIARITASFILHTQMIGRVLRLLLTPEEAKDHAKATNSYERRKIIANSKKPHGIVIDLVGNMVALGPPELPRVWSLGDDNGRLKNGSAASILKYCVNKTCLKVYYRYLKACPHCGHIATPMIEKDKKIIDGDIFEMDNEVLEALRGNIIRNDGSPLVPSHVSKMVEVAIIKRWEERKAAQKILRESIAMWRGCHQLKSNHESDYYRLFYLQFGIDVLSAQILNKTDATELNLKIHLDIVNNCNFH